MELLGQNEVDHRQRKVVILSQDRFYKVLTPEQKAKALKGQYNFDHPGKAPAAAAAVSCTCVAVPPCFKDILIDVFSRSRRGSLDAFGGGIQREDKSPGRNVPIGCYKKFQVEIHLVDHNLISGGSQGALNKNEGDGKVR